MSPNRIKLTNNPHDKRVSASRVVLTSFIVDTIDIILNLTVVIFTGSIIMLSELLEGIADLIASGLLLVGITRSQRKANKIHPFGYGRELYFWTLLAALVMFFVTATFSIHFGWERFFNPKPIHNIYWAFVVLIIGFVTNTYALFVSINRLLRGRPFSKLFPIFLNSSLIETKTTFILDLMGSSAALLGFLSLAAYYLTHDQRLDGLGAMIIGVVLAALSLFLIGSIRDLMVGKSASKDVEDKIRSTTFSIPQVKDVLDLKTMHIGSERLLVNIEVNLEDELTTDEIEKLIDKIKEKIREEVPSVKHIQVELETPDN